MSSALNTQAFIKPGTPILKFNNRKQLPIHRLPFVGPAADGVGLSFWKVPKTGGYTGGCMTGTALGRIYLKNLREHGAIRGGALAHIVTGMLEQHSLKPTEMGSLHGQIVGFMEALEPWLAIGARNAGASLDTLRHADLLAEANNGLNLDEAAYLASQPDEVDCA
ncbi:hypothetical protein ABIE61_001794 [Marinobacterium sp. MBR-111]|jgi:hypothetical protein|uniref:hypothetical protein n=1 Tax=Marinobacterium sp. MBR-111 TaxID=3156463 RepID=UPI003393253E